jgi:hypothetical protein
LVHVVGKTISASHLFSPLFFFLVRKQEASC